MAYAWEPLSDRLGQEEQRAAMDYSRAGCGPFLVIPEDSPRQADDKCRTWNAGVVERASRANTVILVAQWSAYLTPNGELRDMLHDTLVRLSAVPNVLIIGPTPEMHDTVARCLRNDDLAACAMSRAEYDTYASPLLSELRAAAVGMQNVHVIDMSTFFCNESECPPMMDGYSLYWDSHHVSYTAAKAYASQYAEKIAELEENRSYKSRRGAGG
ncbi:hypothetical protein GCM10010872_32240 [Dyella flava]|nr:hypothetical protein GCM10010872_32240 [Dyella flava]